MEIRVHLKLISSGILSVLLLAPSPSEAYSRLTHKGLSDAVIASFEAQRGDVFTPVQEIALIQGSWDEDDDWRFMRHFYDPVNQAGLFGQYEPSKYWAQNTEAQANYECVGAWFCYGDDVDYTEKYFSSPTDFSWDRAIYEYAWGDKVRGAAALGHVIHLIEDATVPAHVRNDAHPSKFGIEIEADPYEKYAAKYEQGSVPVLKQLKIPTFRSLAEGFDQTALFSNSNFLSRDSMDLYPSPNLAKLKVSGGYARNLDLGIRIASARSVLEKKTNTYKIELFFEKGDESVPEDYWRVLSKKAIESGVGVIDLFFREVEKERETGVLKAKNTSAAERRAKESAKKYFGVVKGLYGSSLSQDDVDELLADDVRQPAAAALAVTALPSRDPIVPTPVALVPSPSSPPEPLTVVEPTIEEKMPAPEESIPFKPETITPTVGESAPPIQELFPVAPGFGGGGGGSPVQEESVPAPESVSLSILSPLDSSYHATTTLTFSGTTDANSLLSLESATTTATTTADMSGNWSSQLVLDEGNPTVVVRATDSNGERATSTSVSIFVDVTPPSLPTASLSQCANSLSVDFCLLATTSIAVEWTEIPDASYYALEINGSMSATTTATSSVASVTYGATSSIAVIAYDLAGNAATSTSVTLYAVERPIVINEIAWAGTDAGDTDEWIELYNASAFTLDLSKVTMYIDGASFALSDVLSGGNYYLIEDRAEATSKTHNLVADVDLADTGVYVVLVDATGSVLDTSPEVGTCSGWCGGALSSNIGTSVQFGDLTAKKSMERTSSAVDGALAASWQSNDTYIRASASKATDSSSGTVFGTPGMLNSSGLPTAGWNCGGDTLTVAGGSYNPTSSACTYLSAFINTAANRYGDVYKGTVGSSTLISGHSLGKSIRSDENDSGLLSGAAAGDQFFVALMENRNYGTDLTDFRNYFKTGVGTAPHNNYVTIPWTYAP